VQATGCVTGAGLAGACQILPTLEQATTYALFVVVVGFLVAFAAEYRQQQEDPKCENATQKAGGDE